MLEHLSYPLLEKTLGSWFETLKVDGFIRLEVPNIEYGIKNWEKTEWTAEAMRAPISQTKHNMAFFWGWQGDITSQTGLPQGDLSFWDTYKNGFSVENLGFFLRAAGFTDIEISAVPNGLYEEDNLGYLNQTKKEPVSI